MEKIIMIIAGVFSLIVWVGVISLILVNNDSQSITKPTTVTATQQVDTSTESVEEEVQSYENPAAQTNEEVVPSTDYTQGLNFEEISHLFQDGVVSVDDLLQYVQSNESQ
ncbi:hypothetical protein Q75_11675 [Bacillus coahuilensis p1.1.43]|uniref:Uncharacterized protein n=1 Tax=Bacillus coahuilensis p1.1.43 TaxID=1150625 RepID=A0A147K6H9_9BACI|nr:hypothetical protein [Bacillus coahuilensis]KUP05499.1 hypothetical protein Q75_11675 [Bacillus coahuilensis p1.1.43]